MGVAFTVQLSEVGICENHPCMKPCGEACANLPNDVAQRDELKLQQHY